MKKELNYLVTGGAGFIGSHLIEGLLSDGNNVCCIDDLSSGLISNLPESKHIRFVNKPVQEMDIDELFKIDGIFHLAAQASVPKSIDDFYNSSANNLLGTLKVFDWAEKLNIPVGYASSSAVYGNLPVGDDTVDEFDIISPYAQDKLTMEHYAGMAWKVYKTPSIGLRFFNVYGPRQDPTNPYSGVISIFIDRLLKNMPVTVNGGYQTRDFIYVSDIVDVLLRSMNMLHESPLCKVFNVGTGKSVTIDDLLLSLKKITKADPEVIKRELPPGDPERSSGTYEKLEKVLKTDINCFTSLDTGLLNTVEYCQLDQINCSEKIE
jgi:UDP-glucose 4-epimerase